MKKNLFIFSVCLVCFYNARSQTDTVSYLDPWYLYQPLPTNPEMVTPDFWKSAPLCYFSQSFYTDTPVTIYGVACVIDTLHTLKDSPDSIYRPMLFRYEGTGVDHGSPRHFFSVVDSTSFMDYTRQCKFKYEYASRYGDPQPGDSVFNCFEFYFNRPYRSDTINTIPGYQDTVYIGRYVAVVNDYVVWENYMDVANVLNRYFYATVHGGNEHSNHLVISYHPSLHWGAFFPIVRLRCVQPELRLGRNWYDTTVVSWRTVEAPDGYELSLGDYGSDPDDGTIVALPDSCHSYAFPRLLSNHHYSVWVRKGCAYPNFDTVAWSPWSNPVSFFGPTAPPNPADTTAIDKVPTPQAFTLSPNPASSTVTVSADFALQRVDLYNTAGALVISLPASGNQMDISLEGLLPGTYVVAVATAAGTTHRKLILKE